jgi:hypothetical protein
MQFQFFIVYFLVWLVEQTVIKPATKQGTIFNGWSRGGVQLMFFHGRRLFRGASFYRIRTDREQTYSTEKIHPILRALSLIGRSL